uniref:Uncharacterized protein n=1 Tax=Psilocybe cubensis TaxID=181762 RepID=A0A8H8CL52_PSICU
MRKIKIYLSEISGSIAAVLGSDASSNGFHWLHLFNTDTNVALRIRTPESSVAGVWLVPSIRFHLPYIITIATYPDKLAVFVREVPRKILSDKVEKSYPSDNTNIPTVNWESSVVDYETTPLEYAEPSPTFEPSNNLWDLTSISIMAYTQLETHAVSDFSDIVDFFRFPIDTTKRNVYITGWKPLFTFGGVSKMRLHPDCMGMTGNRVIWRSRYWNSSDRDDITMAYFPSTLPTVPPILRQLILPNSGVPFHFTWCDDGLHLEEASGRIFVTDECCKTYLLEYGPL